ncbi:DUF4190 domain-containing protein [Streptomyces sp. NPDC092369]|uniref:DUF4190 domain-containing protein n=1 Tax=Streptomyces sp. NPDC092369 TaxID=3366015 RepID=UPI0037FE9002
MARRSIEGDGNVVDGTQPGGGAGAERDPWAPPPEEKTSLDKGARPGPTQQPQSAPPSAYPPPPAYPQPPSVHDQPTMAAMPSDGFAPPGQGTGAPGQGAPGFGAPTYGAPGTPPPGWSDSAVPPPPFAPTGPAPQGPGGYGYPAYPQGYGWPGMQPPPQNGMGTAAMVLGILSCCLFCVYGILSVILGVLAVVFAIKGKRRAERGEATNRGQAQSGLITGIIGIVLGLATIALLIVGIAIAVNDDDNSGTDDGSYYNSAPAISAPLPARG